MKYSSKSVKIIGTGSYTPEKVLTNEELETMCNTNSDWIYDNLGIKERHVVSAGETTSDLAAKAALRAIDNAELSVEDIDLIIVCTSTPDRKAPSTACIVQEKIKAVNAAAFDLAAVCSGFIYGFVTGSQFILSGMYDNILVIGADTFSTIVDWSRRDAVFFGDGAGAAVITKCEKGSGLLSASLYADGTGKDHFTVYLGGAETPLNKENIDDEKRFFTMNGKAVYDTASQVIPQSIRAVIAEAGLNLDNINHIIPHQPGIRVLKKSAELLGLPFDIVKTNMDKYANTSGGTIPILLDECHRNGVFKKGDIIVLAGVGSGWTWGAAAIRW